MEFEAVRDAIAETVGCNVDKVVRDARLEEDLDVDSLAAMELIMALEERFDVTIDDSVLDEIKTVGALYDHIASLAA